MEFEEGTIKVIIDTSKCHECSSKVCIEACKVYSRGILELNDGEPSVSHLSPQEVKRRGTECLGCEYECWLHGNSAIRIEIPIKGLADYLSQHVLR